MDVRLGWAIFLVVVLSAVVACDDATAPDRSAVEIMGAPVSVRQGDVFAFSATVLNARGDVVEDPSLTWSVLPADAGLVTEEGRLVTYSPGTISVVAASGSAADTAVVEVTARALTGSISVIGRGLVEPRPTTDLWVHGDVAYTGTMTSPGGIPGNTLFAWNVAGSGPILTDSVKVDARTVNDVKVRADGAVAVLSQERGAGGEAFTILDLSDPEHPAVAGIFAPAPGEMWHGVHNLWIEGDYVYAALDPGEGRRLWIVDISDRGDPTRVAEYHAGDSHLHDVYVRNGLAFLSYWDAGLIILDVGNGMAGGSPTSPVEVSRLTQLGGATHNAWYWPATGYVFVGEEDFQEPGYMHVVDASDLENPVEVASFRVPGDPPHNFWLDEARAVLYMAWYSQGLIALDVSGSLLGDLDRQGRTIASIQYNDSSEFPCFGGTDTCTWAPQLHDGFLYVSDVTSGLWKLEPEL